MEQPPAAATNGSANGHHKAPLAPATNGVTPPPPAAPFSADRPNRELLKIVGQYLSDLGLEDTVRSLVSEAGTELDHPAAVRFRQCVLEGRWGPALTALEGLGARLGQQEAKEMRFLVLEQKYMELLEAGQPLEALQCLQKEMTPLSEDQDRLHRIAALVFHVSPHALRKDGGWLGSGEEARAALMDRLLEYFPPDVLLPPRRLERLMLQALQHQVSHCAYHNTALGPQLTVAGKAALFQKASSVPLLSDVAKSTGPLYADHRCSADSFPSHPRATLCEHTDEVLVAVFSPDGRLLASGGKDCTLIVWQVDQEALTLRKLHTFNHGNNAVIHTSWSHDSSMVAVCVEEDASSDVFIYNATLGTEVCKIGEFTNEGVTTSSWFKGNDRIAFGSVRGHLFISDLEGKVVEKWEGVRVTGVAVDSEDRIIACDTHRRLRRYAVSTINDSNLVVEDSNILSFSLDESGDFALVNVQGQGVHLWDLCSGSLVRRYRGATQGMCTLYSCFGGHNQDFVASASEDHHVYVWHRSSETPVATLLGHSRTVSCVTWNPAVPHMLVSASDDNTLRVWGPRQS